MRTSYKSTTPPEGRRTKIGLEYKQVSSFSDHMQRMTVEEFGERLKERWKALTRNLK
jgi:hypothetical protein